jgi:hypothetical protein
MRGLSGDELILHLTVILRKAFAAMVNIDVDDGGSRNRESGIHCGEGACRIAAPSRSVAKQSQNE